ncbi:MAG: carboxypeptidase regulatory-like domain-containing protein [Candidatus Acidiferrum sp.]
MKHLATALFAVLLSACPACPRASVEVLEIHPSTQKPLITVLKDGAPQQGATLAVFTNNGKEKLIVTTDSHGIAKLPHLHPGIYRIDASTSPTLRGALCLKIAAAHQKTSSAFTIGLRVQPPPLPTFEEMVAAAQASPVSVSGRNFSGTVFDPSGTGIPRVSISIFKQSSGPAGHPRKIRSDEHGRFSASPSPGRYTAVFAAPGFAVQFLTIEIARGAIQNPVTVKLTLRLGAITESVAVASKNENH